MSNARLLREGKLTELDAEHIAEELESMGACERRELLNRLQVLLLHLLCPYRLKQIVRRGLAAHQLLAQLAGTKLEGKTVRIVLFQAQEQEKTEHLSSWKLDLMETSTSGVSNSRIDHHSGGYDVCRKAGILHSMWFAASC